MSSLKYFLFAKRMPRDALLELELSMGSYIEQIYERECFWDRYISLPLLRKLHHQYTLFGRERVNVGSLKPTGSLSAAAPCLMGPGLRSMSAATHWDSVWCLPQISAVTHWDSCDICHRYLLPHSGTPCDVYHSYLLPDSGTPVIFTTVIICCHTVGHLWYLSVIICCHTVGHLWYLLQLSSAATQWDAFDICHG